MQLSARNQLKGKIKDVRLGNIMSEVTVDISGQEIVSVITRRSAQALGLKAGDEIIIVIKSTEVMLAKP